MGPDRLRWLPLGEYVWVPAAQLPAWQVQSSWVQPGRDVVPPDCPSLRQELAG